ncbi:MAG: FTR1 family protein [Allosphingosinicella sp.]|uniref:FTR1 family protein n=1 Tax=Allosphingosinicella sp. TaxID=2823234 RepID=UPI0039297256
MTVAARPLAVIRNLAFVLLLCLGAGGAAAQGDTGSVQTTWRLLDYVAVDYREAVADGRVVNQFEYDEMREFSATIAQQIAALPQSSAKQSLVERAGALQQAIAARADPARVAGQARQLAADLLAAHPVTLAPRSAPDLARGSALYAEQCASCHGATGAGDGPLARGMEPPPIDFTDRDRARERSAFAFYQVINQGLEGTAMQSFGHLPEEDRWALAFHSGRFAYPAELVETGRQLWEGDEALRARIPDLAALAALTPAALARDIGEERAAAVIAYLRSNPAAVTAYAGPGTLDLARQLLGRSLEAYRSGDRSAAQQLALNAYLEGFEPVESLLAARDGRIVIAVEQAMAELRGGIGHGVPVAELEPLVERLDALFVEAEQALAPDQASSVSTFVGAFAILLREGLEALLIVIAMVTFLARADRRDMLKYVHIGWISALVAGVATWAAATYFITISGADRELMEGVAALLAAGVLLFVGIWMHGKAQAGAWQAYMRDRLSKALTARSAWFLAGLAFIAVYREAFETIIFYAALGAQGDPLPLAAGAALAVVLLAAIAWAMLVVGRRLPITKFFAWSAILIAVLAVVLAGKGIAALQEAGWIGVTLVPGAPRSPMLGIYPTVETIVAQVAMAAMLAVGFIVTRRGAPPQPASA